MTWIFWLVIIWCLFNQHPIFEFWIRTIGARLPYSYIHHFCHFSEIVSVAPLIVFIITSDRNVYKRAWCIQMRLMMYKRMQFVWVQNLKMGVLVKSNRYKMSSLEQIFWSKLVVLVEFAYKILTDRYNNNVVRYLQ